MRETFTVQIMNGQNATWQGTVTWAKGKETQSFRSALELIKLIDSALDQDRIFNKTAEAEIEPS